MKRKVLLLLNNAPDVKTVTNDLYKRLTLEGFDVIVASESLFYKYTLDINFPIKYIFSQYLKENIELNGLVFLNDEISRINIWESFFPDFDRFEYEGKKSDREKTNKTLILLYNFFYQIFQNEKIDFVWHEAVSNSFNFSAYNISRLFKADYIGILASCLPNRYEIVTNKYTGSDKYLDSYNSFIEGRAEISNEDRMYINKYLENFETFIPDYMNVAGFKVSDKISHVYFNKIKIRYLLNSLKYYIYERNNDMPFAYQVSNPLKNSLKSFYNQLKRRFKLRIINHYYDKRRKHEESFFLYPLHYHPESSTSVWARHFIDEYNTIRNIAFNLPFGYKLYVKDHPSAVGFTNISFYKKVSELPNVSLISYSENTKNLIRDSIAVITLTSTVGFETLVLGKPVIALGNIYYDKHPLCIKINEFDTLFVIFNTIISSLNSEKKDTVDSFATVWAYYKNTVLKEAGMSVVELSINYIKNKQF